MTINRLITHNLDGTETGGRHSVADAEALSRVSLTCLTEANAGEGARATDPRWRSDGQLHDGSDKSGLICPQHVTQQRFSST